MKKVSLFDVRTIIGALMSLYGVILVLASFSTSDADKAKADGVNANLWVGLALLIFGVLMLVWAITRPIVVDEEQIEADKRAVEEATAQSKVAAHQVVDDGDDESERGAGRPDPGSARSSASSSSCQANVASARLCRSSPSKRAAIRSAYPSGRSVPR